MVLSHEIIGVYLKTSPMKGGGGMPDGLRKRHLLSV